MLSLPDRFRDEFDAKGETFFEIAELLYENHGQQFTLDDLEDRIDVSKPRISMILEDMEKGQEQWINKTNGQMTIVWNTETQNPAATEATKAVDSFYRDLWNLLKYHSQTVPGVYVIFGSLMFAAGLVLFGSYVGFSLSGQSSEFPLEAYFILSVGSFIAGSIVTALGPFQALVNRFLWPYLPRGVFKNKDG